MNNGEQDPMAGGQEQEVKYNSIKFGNLGDWFKGVLVSNTRQMVNNLSAKKEMQTIFEFKALDGSFHNIVKKQIDKDPTKPVKGDVWSYITSKPAMLQQLANAKIGQEVGLKLKEIKPSKVPGQDDAKIIKVILFGMNEDFAKEQASKNDMGGY